jgi:tryptophan synthase alpha chain
VDGFIIPDLPLEEAAPWRRAAAREGVAAGFLAAPTSGPERILRAARQTRGFLYYVSVTGITGARTELPADLAQSLKEVRALVKCPLAVGLGISTPEQVKRLAPFVDGVVVGSAIVQRVAKVHGPQLIKEIGDFIQALKAPLRAAGK